MPATDHGGHLGAILTDTVVQTRNNYDRVVFPQAQARREEYPECRTMSGVNKMLASPAESGIFLEFKCRQQDKKPAMFRGLVKAARAADIPVETAKDAKKWLSSPEVRKQLAAPEKDGGIMNVGPKTADYFFQRCGGDILVCDRHILRYVSNALDMKFNGRSGYYRCQQIAEEAAKILGVKPRQLDAAIWQQGAAQSDK